jgi:hypothetical protein
MGVVVLVAFAGVMSATAVVPSAAMGNMAVAVTSSAAMGKVAAAVMAAATPMAAAMTTP